MNPKLSAAQVSELRAQIDSTVRANSDELVEISHDIWDNPELCFEEQFAHDRLTSFLESAGFSVDRGAFDLPTAFVARPQLETDGTKVGILCEYDALPGLGHACGHNIIAAAGIGAALGAASVAKAAGGSLEVFGTPAEEGGGGKAIMIDKGAFDDIDMAMMIHPADADLDAFWAIAISQLKVEYAGRAAHAAAAPEAGINALDAAVLGYMNVAALRQHIGVSERIHGVFTNGGDKPNIVPDNAAMHWYIRSGTKETLEELKPRVVAALEAGALATGASMTYRWVENPYDDLRMSEPLDQLYASNASDLGRIVRPRTEAMSFIGSTDMGNVSHIVPSIHPMIAVAPPGTPIHTPEFATAARSADGDKAVIDGALAMANTALDIWLNPDVLSEQGN